jgi:hypothetical protein
MYLDMRKIALPVSSSDAEPCCTAFSPLCFEGVDVTFDMSSSIDEDAEANPVPMKVIDRLVKKCAAQYTHLRPQTKPPGFAAEDLSFFASRVKKLSCLKLYSPA